MRRRSAIAALFCATLCAQTPDKIVFEVASVKLSAGPPPNPPGGYKVVPGQVPPIRPDQRRLDVQHGRLNSLLTRAYDIQYADIVGPSWMESEYYDIHAKVPDSAPNGQVPEMLKNLLIERFHMMVHWDVKEVSGYRLAVGNSGAKLAGRYAKVDPIHASRALRVESQHAGGSGAGPIPLSRPAGKRCYRASRQVQHRIRRRARFAARIGVKRRIDRAVNFRSGGEPRFGA